MKYLNVDELSYNLLYSVYSIPNILLPFIGGIFLDSFGIWLGTFVLCVFNLVGMATFYIAIAGKSFGMTVFSRVISGIGGESLEVAQGSVLNNWFRGRELSTAIGLSMCISRSGSSFNSFITPHVYQWTESLTAPVIIGIIVMTVCIVMSMIAAKMEKERTRIDPNDQAEHGSEKIQISDLKKMNKGVWLMLGIAVTGYMAFFSFVDILNKYQ